MSMPGRGKRIALTVRIPYDEYREVVKRSRARGWSISDYVGWCIRRQVVGAKSHAGGATSPHTVKLFQEVDAPSVSEQRHGG